MPKGIVAAVLGLLVIGCQREAAVPYVASAEFGKLPNEAQQPIRDVLREHCGTAQSPKLLGSEPTVESNRRLLEGQAVYRKRCTQCHGNSGDGNGPTAKYLYPRPRDYRRGVFKFTSTPTGVRPRREDLVQTLERGIPGTSMPSFKLLPQRERDAVVEYVLSLTHRGELERQLVQWVESGEEIPADAEERKEVVTEQVQLIQERWSEAEFDVVLPVTPQPRFTAEHVERGRVAFQKRECFKCHGPDGRAQNEEALKSKLLDDWGHPTRAADLTSGMLRGGGRPLDVYRRIHSGVKGTPMPGHAQSLAAEPDTLWDLTAFVLSVSGERRKHKTPESGDLVPFPLAAVK